MPVLGWKSQAEVGAPREDNTHSGILVEGANLAGQYDDFIITQTDLSRNDTTGDPDPGHGELGLLAFNGDLIVEDVVVTSGSASGSPASPFYGAVWVNGIYTPAAQLRHTAFKDITFQDQAGGLPAASLGIFTYSNLDAGVDIIDVSFLGTGKTRGGLYLANLQGNTNRF